MYTEHGGDENGHLHIYLGANHSLQLTDREIYKIDECWNAAKREAATKEQKANVIRSEISWRFWKASMNKSEFSILNPNRFEEKQKLYRALRAHGVTTLSEGGYGDYYDCICIKYAPADEWNDYEADEIGAKTRRFFSRILERFVHLLAAFGLYYKVYRSVLSKTNG